MADLKKAGLRMMQKMLVTVNLKNLKLMNQKQKQKQKMSNLRKPVAIRLPYPPWC